MTNGMNKGIMGQETVLKHEKKSPKHFNVNHGSKSRSQLLNMIMGDNVPKTIPASQRKLIKRANGRSLVKVSHTKKLIKNYQQCHLINHAA